MVCIAHLGFDKNQNIKDLGLDNLHTLLGKTNKAYEISDASISAASISEITGIPRATCIRKLEKFVKMNILEKDNLSKRYYLLTNQLAVNPVLSHGEVVKTTTSIFSDFCAVFLKNINK